MGCGDIPEDEHEDIVALLVPCILPKQTHKSHSAAPSGLVYQTQYSVEKGHGDPSCKGSWLSFVRSSQPMRECGDHSCRGPQSLESDHGLVCSCDLVIVR